jgi:hypothetical protein
MMHVLRAAVLLAALAVAAVAALADGPVLPPGGPRGTSPLPVGSTPAPDPGEDPTDVTPPPSNVPSLPASAKRGGLMVHRGAGELEIRHSFSHFSRSTVVVDGVAMLPVMVVGEIGVERTRRDLLITSLAMHYGLRDNLEAEVKFPFRYHTERRSVPEANPPQEQTVTGVGLSDIDMALYYQLPRGRNAPARYVVSAGLKTASGRDQFNIDPDTQVPLGSGFMGTRFGVSSVRVIDPAALYWNASFTYNLQRRNVRIVTEEADTGDKVVNYVNLKPGNSIDIGGGMAYALNPQLSFNTGLAVSFTTATASQAIDKPQWNKLANSAVTSATLRLGIVYANGGKRPLDLAVNMGLTDDSPDFTLECRQTYKF